MHALSSFARVGFGAALLLALSSACGGQSSKSGDEGSSGSGGVTGRAGSSSSGGSKAPQAGKSSVGGSGNSGGSPNADDACAGPASTGTEICLAYLRRWTH